MAEDQTPQPRKYSGPKLDKELEEFRSLMEPPGTFEDGFSWMAFLGTIFVALMMVPGSIYMSLLAGQGIGPAAQWVTLILFIEVARRANRQLRNAEIFTLFYLAGAIIFTAANAQGEYHGGLAALWVQYFVRSDAAHAAGIASQMPNWVVPNPGDHPGVLEQRSLFMWEWLPALGVTAFTMLIGRFDNMVLGYGLFRLTSDIEKLPFPMAPVGAQGILALSEEQDEESKKGTMPEDEPDPSETSKEGPAESWRWRVFSIGSVIGLVFGLIYLGIPTITGALLDKPIEILPIPFIDYTQKTSSFLPAVATGISLNLGLVLLGMVLPFWAVVGTGVGLLCTFIANPVLYDPSLIGLHFDPILTTWTPGDNMQATFYKNQIDFYFSFSIGIALSIAIVGFWAVFKATRQAKKRHKELEALGEHPSTKEDFGVPEGRGDIRPWFIIVTYLLSSAAYIGVSCWLLYVADGKLHMPIIWIMVVYALVYTPIISYVTARLEGIAGQVLNIPFVKQAAFILSGYQGVAVWFLPIPMHNYGQTTMLYRKCELTGTKFWSIWKSEVLLMPIILLGTLLFAHFIWRLGEIPGPQFPYAQEWWPVIAEQQALIFSSTLGGYTEFEQALNGFYILAGGVIGLISFVGLSWLGAPTFLMYGVVKGLNQTMPFTPIPEFIGGMIGRFYFQKRLGLKWRQYIPVVFAGFSCGMGLIGTLGVGFTFLTKAVFKLPF